MRLRGILRKRQGLGKPKRTLEKIVNSPASELSKAENIGAASVIGATSAIPLMAMGKTRIPGIVISCLSVLFAIKGTKKTEQFADKLIKSCIGRPRIAGFVANEYYRRGYPGLAAKINALGRIRIEVDGKYRPVEQIRKDPNFSSELKKKLHSKLTEASRASIKEELLNARSRPQTIHASEIRDFKKGIQNKSPRARIVKKRF